LNDLHTYPPRPAPSQWRAVPSKVRAERRPEQCGLRSRLTPPSIERSARAETYRSISPSLSRGKHRLIAFGYAPSFNYHIMPITLSLNLDLAKKRSLVTFSSS
jgi:hypothetical protein